MWIIGTTRWIAAFCIKRNSKSRNDVYVKIWFLKVILSVCDDGYCTCRNIVSTVNLDCKLDLKAIALQARNAEYNPKVCCSHVAPSYLLIDHFFTSSHAIYQVLSMTTFLLLIIFIFLHGLVTFSYVIFCLYMIQSPRDNFCLAVGLC